MTGRKALYVNRNATVQIVGIPLPESDALLQFLFQFTAVAEFHCRFRWEPNSIAIWDNRYCNHYAIPDYTERRLTHRVTTKGQPVT